ncbi:MAG: hypothetical protein M1341_00200 [Candidatus Thermoplasmatota archaeon]|jgi:hypothetical protein|nr:hypothetical protein [Candidatus Thermoplasmatota archaeon]
MNRQMLSLVSLILMMPPGLILAGSGYPPAIIAGITEIIFAVAAGIIPSEKGGGFTIFLPFLILAVAMALSQGYLQRLFGISPIVPSIYENTVAFLMVFVVLGIFLSMTSGTSKSMAISFRQSGFDEKEYKSALSSFNSNAAILGFGMLFLSIAAYIAVSLLPELNIGFFPAVIAFGVVYLLIFRAIFSQKRQI